MEYPSIWVIVQGIGFSLAIALVLGVICFTPFFIYVWWTNRNARTL